MQAISETYREFEQDFDMLVLSATYNFNADYNLYVIELPFKYI